VTLARRLHLPDTTDPPAVRAIHNSADLISNAVQYVRLCTKFRTDVTVLVLETMTYPWFGKHHQLTPHVKFPNKRYHPFANDGFSMLSFLDANYPNFVVFNCGGWRELDNTFHQKYDMIPFGFAKQVVRKYVLLTALEREEANTHQSINQCFNQ
jgi:hypothetical protein